MVAQHDIRQTHQTRYSLFDGLVAGFLLLIPIVVFWYVWGLYAVNVPKWDDHALRFFLYNLNETSSISGKLYTFFAQHNEHRIVYDRFITWLDFNLAGKLNYRHLMIVGNLSLFGLLILFGLVIDQSIADQGENRVKHHWTNSLLYLSPVAFLLLNLSHWENMFWGMAALQNFTVLLWVFWSIYLLAFTERFLPAFLLAIVATLTSGNGLLIWPIGFAILLVQLLFENRLYRNHLIVWALGAIGIITLYFSNYKKPPGNPPVRGSIVDLIKGWAAFNGAATEAFPVGVGFVNCLLAGGLVTVLILGIWIYSLEKGLIRKKFSPFDYFFTASTVFLLGTAAVVTWSRVGFGMNGLITSRYKLYSLLLLALVYCFAIVQQQKPGRTWAFCIGLAFSAALMGSSYLTYLNDTITLRYGLLTNQFNSTHSTNRPVVSLDSVSKKYTTLAPAFYDSTLPTIYGPANQSVVNVQISRTATGYTIENTTLPAQSLTDAGNFILARSEKRTYLFPVRQHQQSVRSALFRAENLFKPGFRADLPTGDLDADTYQLFILAVSENKASLYPTNQTIASAGPPTTTLEKNW